MVCVGRVTVCWIVCAGAVKVAVGRTTVLIEVVVDTETTALVDVV